MVELTKGEAESLDRVVKGEIEKDMDRASRAVGAAAAILEPLGFVRSVQTEGFNKWKPGRWLLDSPRMTATLDLQAKPWRSTDADSSTYRLVLSGDYAYQVKTARIAPGNLQAVKDYIEKMRASRRKQEAYDAKLDKLKAQAEELFAHDYPNLKVVDVDAQDYRIDIRVRTRGGALLTVTLDGKFRFVGLKAHTDEEHATALDKVAAALKAL